MIRLTWRQFRTQALVALGGLLVVAVAVLVTRSHLVHMFGESAANTPPGTYDHIVSFLEQALGYVVLAVPALIGVFWGAPLVAGELETGTFRVAWTQSVTRSRWLAVKLGLAGIASIIVAGLFSLLVTWWSGPADSASVNRFDANIFGQRGITPMGYALFAFALGVTAGVLIRRVQPAMVSTFVAFIAARLVVTFWVRPHLWPPAYASLPLTSSEVSLGILKGTGSSGLRAYASVHIPDAWVHSAQIVDKAGHVPTDQLLRSVFPNLGTGPENGGAKLAAIYHVLVAYQPASRYWLFQGLETAVFVAIALVLAGICFWWVRRRLS